MSKIRYFLIVPKREIKQFVHAADREYFSRPVEVTLLFTHVVTRNVQVRDDRRGHEYPADRSNLVGWHRLTNRQRASISVESGST